MPADRRSRETQNDVRLRENALCRAHADAVKDGDREAAATLFRLLARVSGPMSPEIPPSAEDLDEADRQWREHVEDATRR